MKILDIDALKTVHRQVRIDGTLHDVKETTVKQFIDSVAAAEKLEKEQAAIQASGQAASGQVQLAAAMKEAAESIIESIPTLTVPQVMNLGVSSMFVLMAFVRGEADPAPADAQGDSSAEGEDPTKKKPS